MNTTLEAELLQAADRAAIRAQETDEQTAGVRWKHLRALHESESRQLRQRAAWVRELVQRCEERLSRASVQASIELSIVRQLTGPIPAAETAPTTPDTNRCSYCGMMTVANEDGVYCGHEPTCRRAETAPTEREET